MAQQDCGSFKIAMMIVMGFAIISAMSSGNFLIIPILFFLFFFFMVSKDPTNENEDEDVIVVTTEITGRSTNGDGTNRPGVRVLSASRRTTSPKTITKYDEERLKRVTDSLRMGTAIYETVLLPPATTTKKKHDSKEEEEENNTTDGSHNNTNNNKEQNQTKSIITIDYGGGEKDNDDDFKYESEIDVDDPESYNKESKASASQINDNNNYNLVRKARARFPSSDVESASSSLSLSLSSNNNSNNNNNNGKDIIMNDILDIDEVCSICLMEYENGTTVARSPKCSHVYHPDCIVEWLSRSATTKRTIRATRTDGEIPVYVREPLACPMCREILE